MKIPKAFQLLFTGIILQTASAELPTLSEKPWLGYFAGYDQRAYALGIKTDGHIEIEVRGSNGDRMGFVKAIHITPVVMIEGENGWRPLNRLPDSTTTKDAATDKPTKLAYRGKVTGGAEYEVNVEFDRNKVSFGGKIVDQGTNTKPLKFLIRARIGEVYKKLDPAKDKLKVAEDIIKFARKDGKKDKIGIIKEVDFSDQKIFGPLSIIEIEMKAYGKHHLNFSSTGQSPMTLQNPKDAASTPLKGFYITFEHDPQKDPQAKDRMSFETK